MARLLTIVAVAGMLLLAACGSDDDDGDAAGSDGDTTTTAAAADDGDSSGEGDEGNACPVDGCIITIDSVVESDDELEVTWSTNFEPDEARNHIHVYWSTYDPEQVSGNAVTEYDVEQGQWVPTGANPTYTTEGAVSTADRGDATEICVTAADLEHNVLDPSIEDCFDVSQLVS